MIKLPAIRGSSVLGVPAVIWVATVIGLATGAASGVATGEIWIAVTGGLGAGTATLAPFLVRAPKSDEDQLIYNSDTEDPAFATWTYNAERSVSPRKFSNFVTEDGRKVLSLISHQGEIVGLNKSVALTSGVLEFDYMVSGQDSARGVYFAILPMQETGPNRVGLIEVSGSMQDDPANPASPYRIRYFVPDNYRNDEEWHHHRMEFDFNGVPDTFYTIFAVRVNEGMRDRSSQAEVRVTAVRVWRKL